MSHKGDTLHVAKSAAWNYQQ